MRNKRLILCLLLSACLKAQTPASVSGSVTNAVTGAPLPRVHVRLDLDGEWNREYGAMTTSDGRFSVTNVEPGTYTVTTERVGFSSSDVDELDSKIVVRSGENRNDITLKMLPSGAISGRVTNADGDPVEGAEVTAESFPGVSGGDDVSKTDAKGYFRIGGLPPGKYRVKATPENRYTPPEQRTDGTVDIQDAPTYFPGAATFRQGSRAEVAAGVEASGVEIRLNRVPIVSVSGKVEGAPLGAFNAQLLIAARDGSSHSAAGIKPDGTFRVWRLLPGKYEIRATWQAPGGMDVESVPVPFEIAGSSIPGLALRVLPPSDITGRLAFQDDAARPPRNAPAILTFARLGIWAGGTRAEVSADGSFHLTQLPAGRYRLIASWSNVYIAATRAGTVETEGALLDLTNGGSGELSVRMSSSLGSLSGIVADGNRSTAGAHVMLECDGESADDDPSALQFAIVGAAGRYSFDGIAPGKYKIAAVNEVPGRAWTPDAYEDLMESVEIHPGEHVSHDLKRRSPDEP